MTTEEAMGQEAVFEAVINAEAKIFGLTVLRVGPIWCATSSIPDRVRGFAETHARREFAKRSGAIIWPTVQLHHSPLSVWVTAEAV